MTYNKKTLILLKMNPEQTNYALSPQRFTNSELYRTLDFESLYPSIMRDMGIKSPVQSNLNKRPGNHDDKCKPDDNKRPQYVS